MALAMIAPRSCCLAVLMMHRLTTNSEHCTDDGIWRPLVRPSGITSTAAGCKQSGDATQNPNDGNKSGSCKALGSKSWGLAVKD